MIKNILAKLGITALNKMQQEARNTSIERDLVLISPTGSGKTLAFLLPLLHVLDKEAKGVQAIILVPSRELALQIEQVFRKMDTGFRINCCYGGHPIKIEKNNFIEPPAVIIGTPGRLAYHVRHENFNSANIHLLILDEFDKALEFGFQEDMSFIIHNLPSLTRRILTSATEMTDIPAFTGVKNAIELDFSKDIESVPTLKLRAVRTRSADKVDTLYSLICHIGLKPTLIFCNHREAVERISEHLIKKEVSHDVFHGGMAQEEREKALIKFRNGTNNLLITTDLASRGLDIQGIEFIVHYQMPSEEAFIHRNGRTARMHASGTVFLILSEEEFPKFIKEEIENEELPEKVEHPGQTDWVTIYFGAGRKDKINKMDIAGVLMKKGGLQKEEIGLIEVLDFSSFAAVKRKKAGATVQLLGREKIKNKKITIEEAR